MTLEELKKFESSHPQYARLFPMIMKEFDGVAREEFAKAFKAINERMKARMNEVNGKYHTPEADAKVVNDALTEFLKQLDTDFKKNVKEQFAKYQG